MVLNEEQWIKELREKRIAYGISQGRLAVASGITREYLNKIESGKMKPSKELLETLHKELARFNPEAPLTMLFDYVKIRFPTLDIQHIIKDILKLNINYMLHPHRIMIRPHGAVLPTRMGIVEILTELSKAVCLLL